MFRGLLRRRVRGKLVRGSIRPSRLPYRLNHMWCQRKWQEVITTYTVSKSLSDVPGSCLRSFGAFSFSHISRLSNVCCTFRLRYGECERGITFCEPLHICRYWSQGRVMWCHWNAIFWHVSRWLAEILLEKIKLMLNKLPNCKLNCGLLKVKRQYLLSCSSC